MTVPLAAQTARFDLSHDELAWLLYTLRMPPMMGMGKSLYPEGTTEEVANARLQAGGLALQARSWVVLSAETPQIDSLVMGVLGAYAVADRAMVVNKTDATGRVVSNWVYYLSPTLLIEHHMPQGGLHRFTVMPSSAVFLDTILDHLAFRLSTALDLPENLISPAALQATIEQVRAGDAEGGYHRLLDLAWNADHAQTLIETLAAQTSGATVLILRAADQETGQPARRQLDARDSLILVESEMGVVGVTNLIGEDHPQVRVAAFSRNDLCGYLRHSLGLAD